jgi:hypothetical protein
MKKVTAKQVIYNYFTAFMLGVWSIKISFYTT